MKPTRNATEEPLVANYVGETLSRVRSLVDRMAVLQEAADKIGPVDSSFDQKMFFDALQ